MPVRRNEAGRSDGRSRGRGRPGPVAAHRSTGACRRRRSARRDDGPRRGPGRRPAGSGTLPDDHGEAPPTRPGDIAGTLRNIESDFAAIIAPGLQLAFRDRRRVPLSGRTIMGEDAARDVWVCGPGAYVVLKALAFGSRGENKDAYDLFYVVRNYGAGVEDIADCLRPLLDDPAGSEAIALLRRDFLDHNGVGPRRVAEFLARGPDDAIQADVVGFVSRLLDRCG